MIQMHYICGLLLKKSQQINIELNGVVVAAFKLFIDKIELVDNEFKLVNIDVDVAFKLLIDNVGLVENKFELKVFGIANILYW